MQPPNKFFRRYYLLGVTLVFALLGLGIGFKLSAYLLVKLGKGNVPVNASVPSLPDARLEQAWVNLINSAKVSLVIAADQITSQSILEAIDNAATRGVDVMVILSPDTNNDPKRAARGWLLYVATKPKIAIANQPFRGVWVLVDDRMSVFSSVGMLTASDSATAGGFFILVENPFLGRKTRQNLLNLLQHSTILRN